MERDRNNFETHSLNSLLRHQLDRFSFFGNYLYTLDLMIVGNVSFWTSFHHWCKLSNDVLVKFVLVAIESCCVIQDRLNAEKKKVCVYEWIGTMEETLLFIVVLILHLIKRSDNSLEQEANMPCEPDLNNHRMAWILVEELLNRCPGISAPSYGLMWPIMNVIFKAKHRVMRFFRLLQDCVKYNHHFVKMVAASEHFHPNATDSHGNTILHVVTSEVLLEIDPMYHPAHGEILNQQIETTLLIIKVLLECGSYPHAKNKKDQTPEDKIEGVKLERFNPENVITQFKNLLEQYDSTMSLKYLAAKRIVDSQILYKDTLPKRLAEFVSWH